MQQTLQRINRNKLNLVFDSVIFVVFLVTLAPHFSGIAIHEWLSLAFGAAIVGHLLLHWQWLVEVTKRFFGKAQWRSRLNYLLNALLFVNMTVIIYSGLMISKVALPQLGLAIDGGFGWHQLHSLSADLVIYGIGLHVALHWQWIVNMVRRMFGGQPRPRQAVATQSLASTRAQ